MFAGKDIKLRRAGLDDAQLLWAWANDPGVRAVSFSTDAIPWERHIQWLQSKLAAPGCVFFVAMDAHGAPIGQVRYDIKAGEAVISIGLAAHHRGKGYGASIIHQADQELFDVSGVEVIHAYIKAGNEPSRRVFTRAGYEEAGMATVGNESAHHFILRKYASSS